MDIQKIITLAGGLKKLGEIAGVDHSTVSGWKRCSRIPPLRALKIHEALGIPLHEIRPDIWRPAEAAE
jgi:DNA-binding transcriptional regulator YdaS (Cro superfamily)